MGRHSRKGPAPQGSGGKKRAPAGPAAGHRDAPAAPSPGGRDHAAPPAYGTPAHGVPQVRGGHPEHREPGGGWGQQRYEDWQGGGAPGPRHPQQPQGRQTPSAPAGQRQVPGPRREFIDAFDVPPPPSGSGAGSGTDVDAARWRPDPYAPVTDWDDENSRPRAGSADGSGRGSDRDDDSDAAPDADGERPAKGGLGRTFTGIAAAAVTTVLVVVVAGQVTDRGEPRAGAQPSGGLARDGEGAASRSDGRPTPKEPVAEAPALPPTYGQLMARQFPLAADLKGSGEFEAVPGLAKAPGEGRKVRYRIDVEKGLGLDRDLFADAVQKTLNDDRSWAHDGAMTFERIAGGSPDFVITLASPGTTAEWCAKSGLDTTVDNVSCDSAATDRVMINAFRWAQGAKTYGAKAMLAYRQMLINHEIGHRLGHDHVSCRTPGSLAPVMQQQTKTLNLDGVKCRPNPWVFPGG
ncbi:DUF3152 domain-containing protein [Streptomyces sp. NP-1717]|uniref:DUF3152 domain-containing protein n=1 Tax=unclassified Streptomyces TaxID=2593676 RepID=UPI001F5E05EF|nr:DUF3152 domain-containing protein [Streptomyces sp. NP-1717]MCI3222202.1 DUF3152 domain-containing protein [Streptomyces sp. NP-1717]WTA75606.1 DUF3152 domain-containing protein [Streptomyces sp. NBC_00838]